MSYLATVATVMGLFGTMGVVLWIGLDVLVAALVFAARARTGRAERGGRAA